MVDLKMPKRSPTHRKRSYPQPLDTDEDETTGTQETDSVIEPSMRDPGMFDGLTAWFSFSVTPARVANWTDADGKVVEIDEAMYVFSEDASNDDTVAIFESDDFLHDNLSVFHASYIDACIEKGSMNQVKLGIYSLPPIEVQVRIAQKVQFPWETTKPSVDVVSNQLSAIQTSPTRRQVTQILRNNVPAQPLSCTTALYTSNASKQNGAKRRVVQPMTSVQFSQNTANVQTQLTSSRQKQSANNLPPSAISQNTANVRTQSTSPCQKQSATNPPSSAISQTQNKNSNQQSATNMHHQSAEPPVTERPNVVVGPVVTNVRGSKQSSQQANLQTEPLQGQQPARTQQTSSQLAEKQASQLTGKQQKAANSHSNNSASNTQDVAATPQNSEKQPSQIHGVSKENLGEQARRETSKPDSGEDMQMDIEIQTAEMKSPPVPKKGSKSVYMKPTQSGKDLGISDKKSTHAEPGLPAFCPVEALSLVHTPLDDFEHGVNNCRVKFKSGLGA